MKLLFHFHISNMFYNGFQLKAIFFHFFNNMKINSKNSETSIGHYIDVIGVYKKYLAHFDKVEKNLITNGAVLPSFGAHL